MVRDAAADPDGLAAVAGMFAELSQAMSGPDAQVVSTRRVVQFAAQAVTGSDHAGLTVIERGQPHTVDATTDVVEQVDAIQYATGEGPCLDAALDSDVTRADDLTTDDQWPTFAARAVAETPVRGMIAVRLFVSEHTRGALNFYAERPAAFADHATATASIFGSFISLILANRAGHQTIDNLQGALASNRRIGIAIGILMTRGLLTSDQAFDELRVASQTLHLKLRDIANQVVETGELPDLKR